MVYSSKNYTPFKTRVQKLSMTKMARIDSINIFYHPKTLTLTCITKNKMCWYKKPLYFDFELTFLNTAEISGEKFSIKGKVSQIPSIASKMFLALGLLLCFLTSPVTKGKMFMEWKICCFTFLNGLYIYYFMLRSKNNIVFFTSVSKEKVGSLDPLCQLHVSI